MKDNKMKTDTPRTISAMSLKKNEELSEKDCLVFENYVHAEVCAEIERELAISLENQCKAQAEVAKLREAYLKSVERDDFLTQEVERLTKELAAWDYGTRAEREQKRAEKAEAENAKSERIRIVLNEENIRLRRLLEKQHDILCRHGLEEYGN